MLLDQKRFTEALVVSREELALVEQRFGAEHHLSAIANDGLAGVLAGQCKPRDAIAPQEKCCAIFEKEYGAPHPQVALCLGNLAALWANLGEHDRAIEIKARTLSMFEQVTGHPNHVAMAHRNMARSLLELDRLAEAQKAIDTAAAMSKRDADELSGEEAVAAARTAYGAGSCRTAEPLRVQAEALVGSHRAAEALPIAEAAVGALDGSQIDPRVKARAEGAVAAARSGKR
jgi:hypothetical protein